MIIIEFVGCPGVGKSVICSSVVSKLRENGYSTQAPYKYTRHFKTVRRWFLDFKIFLNPQCHRLMRQGRKLIRNLSEPDRKKWFKQILRYTYKMMEAEKQDVDYFVIDEGCLQALTSIDHDRVISEEVLEWANSVIETVYKKRKSFVFFCQLDEAENVKRLRKRNKIGDRFLSGSDDEMINRLNQKRQNLLRVCDLMEGNVHRIDLAEQNPAMKSIFSILKETNKYTDTISG